MNDALNLMIDVIAAKGMQARHKPFRISKQRIQAARVEIHRRQGTEHGIGVFHDISLEINKGDFLVLLGGLWQIHFAGLCCRAGRDHGWQDRSDEPR